MSFQMPATPASSRFLCQGPHQLRTRRLVKSGNTHSPGHTFPVNQEPSGFFTNIPFAFPSRHTMYSSSFFTPGSMMVTNLKPILRSVFAISRGFEKVFGFHVRSEEHTSELQSRF